MSYVLIVDDDPLNVIIFSKLLKSKGGFEVKDSEDVDEILDLCQQQIISLIVMDISLCQSVYKGKPVNGIEITQLLKNNPATCNIPVVLSTAHSMAGDKNRFMKESGADDYISKPIIDHDGFVNTINNLVLKEVYS